MNTINVAIIEDTDEIRESLQVLINGTEGFKCEKVYENATNAIKELPLLLPDVVLMDINMPGMSGIECVLILKDKMPTTQFMMVTVFDDEDSIFNAIKAGASGYILKNTSPTKILEAIFEIYNGGSPMSAGIARCVIDSMQKKKNTTDMLTERELGVLNLLSKGFFYKEIASELDISLQTVKRHIQNIYRKLHVQNKVEALNKAFPK